jgi:hypothetical protein
MQDTGRLFAERTRYAQSIINGNVPPTVERFLNSGTAQRPLSHFDEVIDDLRLERYTDHSFCGAGQNRTKSLTRNIYYLLRPLFPVSFRKHLQRIALKGWEKKQFPAWPVDFTAEDIFEEAFRYLLKELNLSEIPFIWYWPDGYSACCMMTHDVETRAGRDFCETMMRMEAGYDLCSSFELVPEKRYEVPPVFIDQIREHGCEVCVHGLNHDGNLFGSKEVFFERARKINEYVEKWEALGFRSPVLYRNLDWFYALKVAYDMSVPNVGRLDPQPGGCCTVMPYFIGNILELPLTTIQDYPLYHILKQRSLDLWKQQAEKILKRNGVVSFIIHPDYATARWSKYLYESLLEYLAGLRAGRGLWIALPRAINAWWRDRQSMELVNENGQWCIHGPQANRAKIAYASLEQGRIVYAIGRNPQSSVVGSPTTPAI